MPEQNGRYHADDIFIYVYLNFLEKFLDSLKFVPKQPIDICQFGWQLCAAEATGHWLN